MRVRLVSLLAAVAIGVGGLTVGSTRPAQAAPTVVPDPGFAACLNGYLGQAPTAPITAAQLADLGMIWIADGPSNGQTTHTVDCYTRAIRSVEGAQYLTHVSVLNLFDNSISDLTPLAGLVGLTSLVLDFNRISDVSPLGGLSELMELRLTGNQISDVSPLGGLTRLNRLTVGMNQITDVSALAGLTGLTMLDFDANHVGDVSSLAKIAGPYHDVLNGGGQTLQMRVAVGQAAALPVVPLPWMEPLSWTIVSGPATLSGNQVTMSATGTAFLHWESTPIPLFEGTVSVTAGAGPSLPGMPMYRLYNPVTGEHFFTADLYEATVNVASGAWRSEGIGWYAPVAASVVPVYRLGAKPGTGSAGHLFTTSSAEVDAAMATGQWNDEGIGWNSNGAVSIYRQYNPSTGQHNYTSDFHEIDVITTEQAWVAELGGNPAWTGVAPGDPGDQTVIDAVKNYRP